MRRFRSSVFRGREKLLSVRTLGFLTFKVLLIKRKVKKGIEGDF